MKIKMKATVTIDYLRAASAAWSWRAQKSGMGWRYLGEKDGKSVKIYAKSVLSGYYGDDYETAYYADDGKACEPFSLWLFRNCNEAEE
jgi:hypothetical protein